MFTQKQAQLTYNGFGSHQKPDFAFVTGVDDLQAALQLNFKPIVAAVVNVNSYEQRANKEPSVDQQGGDMGLNRLTQ